MSRQSLEHRSRGFTIVELLIVVVVIAILASITVVAFRGVTESAKSSALAAELGQWKKKAEIYKAQKGIICPDGYVFIYGNSALGTTDFCVMTYEAKNVGGIPTSEAVGTPWVSISQTDAITASTAAGGHLITEAEWMTIAADVLSVKFNWSGGAVGAGYVYQGHVNNNPGSALAASSDDADGLSGITGGTGTTSGTNSTRVLYLSSGDAIWDFSGNVWEWTQVAIGTPSLTVSQIGVSGDSAFVWRQYTLSGLSFGNLPTVSRPSSLASVPGLSAIASWNSSQGIGQIYANYADASVRAFRRGGTYADNAYSGVLTLGIYAAPSGAAANVGFRVSR